jgi:hypothetical protein
VGTASAELAAKRIEAVVSFIVQMLLNLDERKRI